MIIRFRSALITALACGASLLLAGCGDGGSAANSGPEPVEEGVPSAATRPPPVDVCALFSDDDAKAIARSQRLSVPTISTVTESGAVERREGTTEIKYSLKKEPRQYSSEVLNPPLGGCEFSFYSETPPHPKDFNGNCVIEAVHLDEIGLALYRGLPRVSGLGDEAFNEYGDTRVRVGNILLRSGECSLGNAFLVEIYKRMVKPLREVAAGDRHAA
jgi:hypothetical protein